MAQASPIANRWILGASGLLKRSFMAAARLSQWENKRFRYVDRRAEPRLKVPFSAQISGESGSRAVRGVDLNTTGALFLATRPLAADSVVFVHVKNFGLMGFAKVRHCTARGVNRYAIGVEFPKPLMKDEIGTWEFHRVRQTESGGWSVELETSVNLGSTVRAA